MKIRIEHVFKNVKGNRVIPNIWFGAILNNGAVLNKMPIESYGRKIYNGNVGRRD